MNTGDIYGHALIVKHVKEGIEFITVVDKDGISYPFTETEMIRAFQRGRRHFPKPALKNPSPPVMG